MFRASAWLKVPRSCSRACGRAVSKRCCRFHRRRCENVSANRVACDFRRRAGPEMTKMRRRTRLFLRKFRRSEFSPSLIRKRRAWSSISRILAWCPGRGVNNSCGATAPVGMPPRRPRREIGELIEKPAGDRHRANSIMVQLVSGKARADLLLPYYWKCSNGCGYSRG